MALALWRAVARRSLVWWMLFGAFGAGALYAKLSAVLILVPAAAWILFDALERASPPPAPHQIDARAQRFLLFFTLGPLGLVIIAALLSHAGLKTAWGSGMFNFVGLLAIALTAGRFTDEALRRIALTVACVLVAVPLSYATAVRLGAHRPFGEGMRVNWPQRTIADRLGGIWTKETGRPLRIVAGEPWIAGLVGLTNKDTPSILTHGDTARSPWITPGRIDREGMLVVWEGNRGDLPPRRLPLLANSRTGGEERFSSIIRGSGPGDRVIGYAIVPPKPGAR